MITGKIGGLWQFSPADHPIFVLNLPTCIDKFDKPSRMCIRKIEFMDVVHPIFGAVHPEVMGRAATS